MKKSILRLMFALIFANACFPIVEAAETTDRMFQTFQTPPADAKPKIWWRWMGTQISKEGITCDLEALKNVGIGGVIWFQVAPNVNDASLLETPNAQLPKVKTLSKEWWDLIQFTVKETERLGLTFSMQNCLGFSSNGGPWITPEQSMQKLIWNDTTVVGNRLVKMQLLQPKVDARWNYYKDVAVMAVKQSVDGAPVPLAEVLDISKNMNKEGLLTWKAPAGNWKIFRYGHTTTGVMQHPVVDYANGLECDKMNREALKTHFDNFTGRMLNEAGTLTGKTIPSVFMDSYEAGAQTWTPKFREKFIEKRGYDPLPWLVTFGENELRKSGFSGLSWIPGTGKIVVESVEKTNRFRADLVQTIEDLFIEENCAAHTNLIHQYPNLKFELQPYNSTYNFIAGGRKADYVGCEFWHSNKVYGWWSIGLAASASHIMGQPVVPAEAFTAEPSRAKWNMTPIDLKAEGDLAFAKGANAFEVHVMAHQPWDDNVKPGMVSNPWGVHLTRHNTWWNQCKPWVSYLTRSQYLLRQGTFVGDICYLYPRWQKVFTTPDGYRGDAIDENSIIELMSVENGDLVLPSGMRYKALVLTPTSQMTPALAEKIKQLVADGAVIIGRKPESSPSLTDFPACDQKVKAVGDLLWGKCDSVNIKENSYQKGKVVWEKAVEDVLKEMQIAKDFEVKELVGKDDVAWIHRRTADADIYFVSNQKKQAVKYNCIFRTEGKVPELWNAETGSKNDAIYWKAEGKRTAVALELKPLESVFVVFNRPSATADPVVSLSANADSTVCLQTEGSQLFLSSQTKGSFEVTTQSNKKYTVKVGRVPQSLAVTGSWNVAFPANWGAPTNIVLPELISLTDHADAGVKYFSGTMTYTKTVIIPANMLGKEKRVKLDLGDVKNIAEVSINNKAAGLLWKAPFVLDITDFVQAGDNSIEIKVTNTWANRMIGDEQEPQDLDVRTPNANTALEAYGGVVLNKFPDWFIKGEPRPSKGRYTFSSYFYYRKGDKCPASGLIGPVRILPEVRVKVY